MLITKHRLHHSKYIFIIKGERRYIPCGFVNVTNGGLDNLYITGESHLERDFALSISPLQVASFPSSWECESREYSQNGHNLIRNTLVGRLALGILNLELVPNVLRSAHPDADHKLKWLPPIQIGKRCHFLQYDKYHGIA
jgi:hypothetical protein